jgi:predicted DNA-binding transcriptional regulator AlpA
LLLAQRKIADPTTQSETSVMKMLRLPEVIDATGLSRATIYRLEVRGSFRREEDWG